VGIGRSNARKYPLNFSEKGIRKKNIVKYPKKLIGMGMRENS
jgi:hypothetical protein